MFFGVTFVPEHNTFSKDKKLNKVVVSCSLANLLVLLYEHSHRYYTNFLSKINTNKIILIPLQDERGGNISIRTIRLLFELFL